MAETTSASASPEHDEATAPTSTAERGEVANKLVDRFAIWSGVAGLIPIPVVDVLTIGGLQIQMLRRLSQIYGVEFSENRGKALIAALAGTMFPATSGMGAASAMKAIRVVNILAAGFVMPVLSAGASFAIGKAFIQHFDRAARCSISILRTIANSSRRRRRCGNPDAPSAPTRLERRRRPRDTGFRQPMGKAPPQT